jgi:4-carboxymuconolactone decarboxylase
VDSGTSEQTTRGELYRTGLQIRREVLGADWVDRALQTQDDFNRPFQELLNEYCWGTVWARPGLSRQTRSLLNLAMLIALNRPNELELHVRGALTNGVSRDEIREVFLQAAIYCGVPAAVEAFRIARRVFDEAPRAPGGESR